MIEEFSKLMQERKRTLRSLWLARAERAKCEQDYWKKLLEHCEDYYIVKNGKDFTEEICFGMIEKWNNVEIKCKSKAEGLR